MLYDLFSLTELIRDDTIKFEKPEAPAELLIQTIVSDLEVNCQTPLVIDLVQISTEADLEHELSKRNVDPVLKIIQVWASIHFISSPLPFLDDPKQMIYFIIILDCKIAESLVKRLQTMPNEVNILFLDFLICKPLQTSIVYHLEAFHIDVRYSVNLPQSITRLTRLNLNCSTMI